MRYTIIRMDKRFTHHDRFEYCIKFSASMTQSRGPLQFNDAVKWFTETYGWSAEVRQYDKIMRWVDTSAQLTQPRNWGMTISTGVPSTASGILLEPPDCCNPNWSWTNGYDDLRIYVKSSAELNFFQLRWPNEQG